MPSNAKRILLIDDDHDLRRLVTVALKENFSVVGCDSAEAALVRMNGAMSFDLFIVDIMLPGMSGLDFVRKIRAGDALSGVPILMITSRIGDDTRALCRAAGATTFVNKPFTVRQLKDVIDKLLVDPREKLAAAFAAHERSSSTPKPS